jgi:hypothetical protein
VAYLLGDAIRHYQEQGGLDGLIHYFIVAGSMEWSQPYLERANHILGQHNWRFCGEYAVINQRGEVSEYIDRLDDSQDVDDCQFIPAYDSDLPGVVLAADIIGVGQCLLMSFEGLKTDDGVSFSRLYDSDPKQHQPRVT